MKLIEINKLENSFVQFVCQFLRKVVESENCMFRILWGIVVFISTTKNNGSLSLIEEKGGEGLTCTVITHCRHLVKQR